jgi:Fuc2NAc and GlcNAc transferase
MNKVLLMQVTAIAFVAAFLFTVWLRALVRRMNMVDVPNDRSSHSVPTPRGGGLSISVCVLGTALAIYVTNPAPVAVALLAGGIPVMVIGWIDDWRGLPHWLRGAVYLAASAAVVYPLGGVSLPLLPAPIANIIAILGVAWLTNLYNFMDGTDAIAAVEGISAAGFAAVLFVLGDAPIPALICTVLAAACAGFLPWNWPPAKIFMGDVGSCVIGFTFGVLAIAGAQGGQLPLAASFVLLALFVMDATLTLLRRVIAGEKWYSPHRSHAYQLLVQSGMSHRRLALSVLAVNCLLLGPLAVWSVIHPQWLPSVALVVALGTGAMWAMIQWRTRRA